MDMVFPLNASSALRPVVLHLAFDQASMKDHAAADESLEKLIGRRERCIEACGPSACGLRVGLGRDSSALAAKCLVERAGTLVYRR
jgi:hypothetical protein